MNIGDTVIVRDLNYAQYHGIVGKRVRLINYNESTGWRINVSSPEGDPIYLYNDEFEPISPLEQLAEVAE
jgi:hypothetical protein